MRQLIPPPSRVQSAMQVLAPFPDQFVALESGKKEDSAEGMLDQTGESGRPVRRESSFAIVIAAVRTNSAGDGMSCLAAACETCSHPRFENLIVREMRASPCLAPGFISAPSLSVMAEPFRS